MLKNVLIGTNVAYTSATSPYLLTSGQIGVYSLANDGTYTLITAAISAAQALLPVVIAQGVPAGKNIKMFTIQPGEKRAYLTTPFVEPIPNVFVTGYDGVTAAYALPSGIAGTYDFKVQNLTYGNPPFPTVGSTPFFQTNAAATQIAIAEAIVKDVNTQFLLSNNDVMPAQRFAFAETLSAAATAALTSTPTATVTNGSTTVTFSATSTDLIVGSWLRFGAASGNTYAIYQIADVNGTTVTLVSRALAGTSATFSSSITANGLYANAGNSARFYRSANDYYWGVNNDSNNYLNFGTFAANGTAYGTNPKMILLDNGNVGIGTSSPSSFGVGGSPTVLNVNNSSTSVSQLAMSNQDNSNGAVPGVINFAAGANSAANKRLAEIAAIKMSSSTSVVVGDLAFYTNDGTTFGERMRITSGGSVLMGIGTNSASARLALDAIGMAVYNGGFYRQCYMDSNIMYWYNGSNQASLTSAGVWTDASDISIKKDVIDIKYGLDAVLKLKPRSYKMKNDDLEQVGFIAQEVEQVIAELVSTDNKGMKGLSYGQLTAVLVKAVQELKAEIEQLKQK